MGGNAQMSEQIVKYRKTGVVITQTTDYRYIINYYSITVSSISEHLKQVNKYVTHYNKAPW